jgi:hypothetical protein
LFVLKQTVLGSGADTACSHCKDLLHSWLVTTAQFITDWVKRVGRDLEVASSRPWFRFRLPR